MIYSKDIPKICLYCEKSSNIFKREELMCSKQGIVSPDYSCKHYSYDPYKRIPKRKQPIPKYSAKDFSIDE